MSYIHFKHISNRIARYQNLSTQLQQNLPWEKFYSQHQWMILCRQHVALCLKYSSKVLVHFEKVHAVDEHYFVCLFQILKILQTQVINYKTTYCDWSNKKSMHPKVFNELTDSQVFTAQSKGCFFMRKVSESASVGNYLINCLTNFRKDKLKGR